MNLIVIYGPPASGKFTIGSMLAKQTSYKLFHNHTTVPIAQILFPEKNNPPHRTAYISLLKQLRLAVIKAASKENINLIFTLAYSGSTDDGFINQIVKVVKNEGGKVHFVQLTAYNEVLIKRVTNVSRLQLGKMTDPELLKRVLHTQDLRMSVLQPDILRIDTANISPAEACKKIIKTFTLR